jgi:DNA-binding beta-propeller fold protein YncE
MRIPNLVFLAVVLALHACDEKPPVKEDIPPPVVSTRLAIICDEGNFQWGNAGITVFDMGERILIDNAYQRANNEALGDVCQSAAIINNNLFLVVNNSKKIEVISPVNFKKQTTISGFHSPRYITSVSSDKAYVSEYYNNSIKAINPNNGQIIQNIYCPGWHDEMLFARGKLYVSTFNHDKIYIIDEATNTLRDSIKLTFGSNSMVLDANDKLWVLCAGDINRGLSARLYRINTAYDTVEITLPLNKANATRLCTNRLRNRLYWIADDIYSTEITSGSVSAMPLILAQGRNFYGLAYNNVSNELWVSDAVDFTQRSTIYRHRMDGAPIGDFKSGVNSGFMLFYAKQ